MKLQMGSLKKALLIVMMYFSLLFIIEQGFAQLADSPWPMFRHDLQHTGYSSYEGPKIPELKWKFNVGSILSSPSIGEDGTIYVGLADGAIHAIQQNGVRKFEYVPDNFVVVHEWDLISSPAIGSDGTIYIGSFDGHLYAIDSYGILKWKFNTGYTGMGVRSSPVIGSDGTIYIASYSGYIFAVNPNGSLKWKFQCGATASSPAIGSDGVVYVGSGDKFLYAINPDSSLKWKFETNGGIISSPAIDSNNITYVGSDDHNIYAINPNGTLKWKFTTNGPVYSSPAISSYGTIFVGSNDKNLYAISLDGTLRWKFETGWYGYFNKSSPAIDKSGIVYISTQDNYLYAIDPDGSERWRFKTDDEIYSSPVIGPDNKVYICCSDGYLYSIRQNPDEIPPSSISDLSIINISSSSILLSWTSPGDDGHFGAATKYDIRYSTYQITPSNWETADKAQNTPSPLYSNLNQTYRLEDLSSNTTYYVGIKAADEVDNWSELSNLVSATTIDTIDIGKWNIVTVDHGISFNLASLAVDKNIPYIAYYGGSSLYFSKYNGDSWISELIGAATNVSNLTLAIDNNNQPHILYRSGNNLKYTLYKGTSWQTQNVDIEGILDFSFPCINNTENPCFCYYDANNKYLQYANYDGYTWHSQIVDSDGDVGKSPSLFLDKEDKPHISYFDATNKNIKYAFYDGLSWILSVVDTSEAKPFSSLVVDNNGKPHIAYCTYTETCDWYDMGICINQGPDILHLKHAYYNSSVWEIEGIESTVGSDFFLSLTPEGYPFIVFHQGERECVEYVPFLGCINTDVILKSTNYAAKHEHSWLKGAISDPYRLGSYIMDSNGNIHHCFISDGSVIYDLYFGSTWQDPQVVEAKKQVGLSNSLVLDKNDHPHISYWDEANGNLKYAYYNDILWKIETIDSAGNVGINSDIVLDNNECPHISYRDVSNADLKYAYYDGSVWRVQKVDSLGNVGTGTSIVLDNNGYPHISYYDATNEDLKYASYNGSSWEIERIDSIGVVGVESSLVYDKNGIIHIAYDDRTNNALKYAFYNGTSWQISIIALEESPFKSSISLDLDNEENLLISYSNNGILKCAYFNGSQWQIQIIDYNVSYSSSLISRNGQSYIGYNSSSNELRFALQNNQQWCIYDPSVNTYSFSIALDSGNHPHISYYNSQNGSLNYVVNPLLTEVESSFDNNNRLPMGFKLLQNYPNPFNPSTNILFDIPKSSHVKITIYNILGQIVKTIIDENRYAGSYNIKWDGKDNTGDIVSTGVYFCHMKAGDFSKTIKIMLIR